MSSAEDRWRDLQLQELSGHSISGISQAIRKAAHLFRAFDGQLFDSPVAKRVAAQTDLRIQRVEVELFQLRTSSGHIVKRSKKLVFFRNSSCVAYGGPDQIQ